MRTRIPALLLGLAAFLPSTPARAQVPAGADFQLNEGLGTQAGRTPIGAALPNGTYVVVWNTHGQPQGNVDDVFARRFDARGQLLGAEFRVNTYTTGYQLERRARPAVDARGNFVVVWTNDFAGAAPSAVFGQRFAPDGSRQGGEFAVSTGTRATDYAQVARAADGRFIAVWEVEGGDGSGTGLYGRRFSADGTAQGVVFAVNTFTAGSQYAPQLAMRGSGAGFVVVWTSLAQDGSGAGVFAQRFDEVNQRLGAEFRVNTTTAGSQYAPSLAMAADNRFTVAWTSVGQDGSAEGVVARRFDANASALGAEFLVNQYTPGPQGAPSLSADQAGNFVVEWYGTSAQGAGSLSARRFAASGTPRGGDFPVATGGAAIIGSSALASDGVGNFAVTYFVDGPTSTDHARARRFQGLVPAALSVDGSANGVLEPGESAIVVPSWRNVNGAAQTFAGLATSFTGPGGAVYTIQDGIAAYGTAADGATLFCSDCYRVAVPNVRPVIHWDPILEERLTPDTQGQDKLWALHVGNSFTDVPSSSSYFRFVEILLHRGITGGCAGTAYCPGNSTTRAQMAVFLLVSKEGAGYAPAACGTPLFPDVPAANTYCRWVEELVRRGVTSGCGSGLFCPDAAVTREQMAVFVLRTLDPTLDPPACAPPNVFGDVPESSPFCRWIEELSRRGIATGCGNGSFCPGQSVTREQMAVFLSVTFGLTLYGP
jgi:hypothetical protein